MEMNYCRRCGSALTHKGGHVYTCANSHTIFANASPTVGVFFLTPDNTVLLSVRGIDPGKGLYDSFGGFVDGIETLESAYERELAEELGLKPGDYEEPVYLTSGTGYYRFGGEKVPVLSVFYWSRLTSGVKPMPADDVAEIVELSLDDIDYETIHNDDVKAGMRALQDLFQKENS